MHAWVLNCGGSSALLGDVRTTHSNCFTLDSKPPPVHSNSPAKCEVLCHNDCREKSKDRQTVRLILNYLDEDEWKGESIDTLKMNCRRRQDDWVMQSDGKKRSKRRIHYFAAWSVTRLIREINTREDAHLVYLCACDESRIEWIKLYKKKNLIEKNYM